MDHIIRSIVRSLDFITLQSCPLINIWFTKSPVSHDRRQWIWHYVSIAILQTSAGADTASSDASTRVHRPSFIVLNVHVHGTLLDLAQILLIPQYISNLRGSQGTIA